MDPGQYHQLFSLSIHADLMDTNLPPPPGFGELPSRYEGTRPLLLPLQRLGWEWGMQAGPGRKGAAVASCKVRGGACRVFSWTNKRVIFLFIRIKRNRFAFPSCWIITSFSLHTFILIQHTRLYVSISSHFSPHLQNMSSCKTVL